MKIALLSCLYPYRGGISQFAAAMAQELGQQGHEVRCFNFKRQYPSVLFPGKTQYVTLEDEAAPIASERVLDSIGPASWSGTARKILAWGPDLVIVAWWNSFFGPSLGHVAHRVKKHGIPVVGLLHNVIPHEPRFYDKPLTKLFLNQCSGHITLSEEVDSTLKALGPYKSVRLFHPVYTHFGEKPSRERSEELLGIPHGKKNLLFFGLVRKYKGLDILLEAFRGLPADYQLLIAGEPYGSFEEYRQQIDSIPDSGQRIHCFLNYIRDSEVRNYFGAADVCVLPYRSATQSGVQAVACHFGVPMIVTDVGGLRESIGQTGTGLVAPSADPEAVRAEILRFFGTPGLRESCSQGIDKFLQERSWNRFCTLATDFAKTLL